MIQYSCGGLIKSELLNIEGCDINLAPIYILAWI